MAASDFEARGVAQRVAKWRQTAAGSRPAKGVSLFALIDADFNRGTARNGRGERLSRFGFIAAHGEQQGPSALARYGTRVRVTVSEPLAHEISARPALNSASVKRCTSRQITSSIEGESSSRSETVTPVRSESSDTGPAS